MPIKQISKKSVSEEIFDQIKNNILSGELKPGDRITPENELKDLFGVSRNSVRAALQKLIALGLVTVKQGEGTFVSKLSPAIYMNSLMPMLILGDDDMVEMLEFRRMIEIESVKLAVQRAEPKDIKELDSIIENMGNEKYDPKKFAEQDCYFHETIARSTKNSVLLKVYMILKDVLLLNQIEIQRSIGPSLAFKYHPMILEAIKNRDANLASKIMEKHINLTIDKVKYMKE